MLSKLPKLRLEGNIVITLGAIIQLLQSLQVLRHHLDMVLIELIETEKLEGFQLRQRRYDEMDDIFSGKQRLAYCQNLEMGALWQKG